MAERLLTVPQAAERFRVSRVTVYELLKTGQLASLKIGRARRIPESAVDTFIASRTSEASSDAG